MPDEIQVCTSHHVDSDEPDAEGMVEWRYEYDIYEFTSGTTTLVARSYVDEPEEAHFLRIDEDGVSRALEQADLRRPVFVRAVEHLRSIGKAELSWLSPSMEAPYSPVD